MICAACAHLDCELCEDQQTCECPEGHSTLARLEARLVNLEDRFQRFLETHELWDGS